MDGFIDPPTSAARLAIASSSSRSNQSSLRSFCALASCSRTFRASSTRVLALCSSTPMVQPKTITGACFTYCIRCVFRTNIFCTEEVFVTEALNGLVLRGRPYLVLRALLLPHENYLSHYFVCRPTMNVHRIFIPKTSAYGTYCYRIQLAYVLLSNSIGPN